MSLGTNVYKYPQPMPTIRYYMATTSKTTSTASLSSPISHSSLIPSATRDSPPCSSSASLSCLGAPSPLQSHDAMIRSSSTAKFCPTSLPRTTSCKTYRLLPTVVSSTWAVEPLLQTPRTPPFSSARPRPAAWTLEFLEANVSMLPTISPSATPAHTLPSSLRALSNAWTSTGTPIPVLKRSPSGRRHSERTASWPVQSMVDGSFLLRSGMARTPMVARCVASGWT